MWHSNDVTNGGGLEKKSSSSPLSCLSKTAHLLSSSSSWHLLAYCYYCIVYLYIIHQRISFIKNKPIAPPFKDRLGATVPINIAMNWRITYRRNGTCSEPSEGSLFSSSSSSSADERGGGGGGRNVASEQQRKRLLKATC